jgi:hypothetical protein
MHQVNPRFYPGGWKKLRAGLEAHDTILLNLQAYNRLYRIKKTYMESESAGRGDTLRTPRFKIFIFYFF